MTVFGNVHSSPHDILRKYGIYLFLCLQFVFYGVYIQHTSCVTPTVVGNPIDIPQSHMLMNLDPSIPEHAVEAHPFNSNDSMPSIDGNLRSTMVESSTQNSSSNEQQPLRSNAEETETPSSKPQLPPGYGPVQNARNNKLAKFAYVFYITDEDYGCSALVNAYRLSREVGMDPSIDIVFMVLSSRTFSTKFFESVKSLNIKLKLVDGLKNITQGSNHYYADCMIKLRVFELEEYTRVVFFDSDIMIIKNMDHLFYLPSTLIAAPRAWWISQPFFTSILLVIEPSKEVFEKRILERYHKDKSENLSSELYDMDLLNTEFKNEVMYLPGYYGALDALYGKEEKWKGFESESGPRFKRIYTQEEAIPFMFFLHMTGNGKYWNIHSHHNLENSLPFFKQTYEMWWRIHDYVC